MAVGDRVEKRMSGPSALSTSSGSPTTATVPASKQWTVKQVVFTNTAGVEALVYFSVGAIGTAGNRVFSGLPIAAGDTIVWDTAFVLDAAESVQAYADRSGLNMVVAGWEKSV